MSAAAPCGNDNGDGQTETTSERWKPREGEVVNDRWRLERRASTGISVETWEGVDLQLKRRIALQVVLTTELDDLDAHRAFERRVTLLAKVQHPNVMRIFDVVRTNGHSVSVCEWIDGVVLEDLLRKGFQGWIPAACVGIQIAAGMGAIHGHDVVHRDLFPPNVMITHQGVAKITGGGRVRNLASDSTLTDQELLVVKAGYVAPERIEGRGRDPRVDVFAAGVMLWEMATGRRVADLISEEPGPPEVPHVRESVPDVPDSFDEVVFAATRPDRDDRPADGVELYELLSPLVPKRPSDSLVSMLEDFA